MASKIRFKSLADMNMISMELINFQSLPNKSKLIKTLTVSGSSLLTKPINLSTKLTNTWLNPLSLFWFSFPRHSKNISNVFKWNSSGKTWMTTSSKYSWAKTSRHWITCSRIKGRISSL
ncbi:hypothetical protein WICPIJ_007256 [Wickerhamomyces pijperi]|uniref:Uncharacterized protein n=1 Tax=Wickerhamomyces pijperi TaxID=599730 RepID=A0A9P8TKM8_WICPI|nr:hypothetical protein WICPIJ_007256 [Wickerhamomyces pijperi]